MKKIFGFISLVFSMVILFSCEPSRAENGDLLFGLDNTGESGGGGTSTSRLLKKIISHEKDEATGEFVDSEMIYMYEGDKLVSTEDDTGELTEFTYNSDKKINKIEGSAQTTTLEYQNNAVSKVITEIAGFSEVTSNYTHVAGKLTKTVSTQEFTLPFPVKNYVETTYEYNGVNISKGTIKFGIYLPDGTLQMNPETTQLDFTYDQKKSPYSLLPKEFGYYVAGIAPQGAALLSSNNLIKFVTTTAGISQTMNYVYEYDALNYAIKNVDGDDYTKYEYQ